jgi:DNA polymerase-3 subunit delta'
MAWDNIIGQDRIKNILGKAIFDKRISHAYCFWGIDGCGKDALAFEFAKAANCLSPIITENLVDSCGECPSCKQAATMQHPNIQFVFSLPTPKGGSSKDDSAVGKMSDEQIEEIKEQINLKSENLYHRFSVQGGNQIKIAGVRELKRNLSMTSIQRGRRFIIISRADEMTVEAANAFLKTLEEPHSDTTIIMTTSKHELILPTIMSRSQQIHCEPIPDEKIIDALINKHDIQPDEAKLISAFAQGSYTQALEYLDADMKEFRETVVNIFRNSLKKHKFRTELLTRLEDVLKLKDKKKMEKLLSLLLIWIRDALIIVKTGSTQNIINADQLETINKFAQNFSKKALSEAINEIEISISKIRRNVMPELIFIDLFMKLRAIFLDEV